MAAESDASGRCELTRRVYGSGFVWDRVCDPDGPRLLGSRGLGGSETAPTQALLIPEQSRPEIRI